MPVSAQRGEHVAEEAARAPLVEHTVWPRVDVLVHPRAAHAVGEEVYVSRWEEAAAGGCQQRCHETILTLPFAAFGRCVAYSISTSPHEARMCSMWDAFGFIGPGGDGHHSRTCHVLSPSPTPAHYADEL